jgi:Ribbon-helix-helix protein, copG family
MRSGLSDEPPSPHEEADVSLHSVIVAVDSETLDQLRAVARSERATLAEVIRRAIRAHLSPASRTRS